MTHKAECVLHCKEYLQSLNLLHYFNNTDFETIYKRSKGERRNAVNVGLNAADFILINATPIAEETNDNN